MRPVIVPSVPAAACPELGPWLTALHDGEVGDVARGQLADDEATDLRAHVAVCAGCRRAWDQSRSTKALLQAAVRADAPALPAGLEASLTAMLWS